MIYNLFHFENEKVIMKYTVENKHRNQFIPKSGIELRYPIITMNMLQTTLSNDDTSCFK